MPRDLRVDQLPLDGLEPDERAFLVCAHEAAISGDIGYDDRRQPPDRAMARLERRRIVHDFESQMTRARGGAPPEFRYR
jgi:hypothetical protein